MPIAQAQLLLATTPAVRLGEGAAIPLAMRDALLLAWLAVEGPTARTRLALLLWPQAEPAAARNALRQRLFQLRRQLGVDVVSGQATLTLAEGTQHDLDEADSVLAACEVGVGGEIEQWLALQRERRQERLRHSLGELSEMAEQAQDWHDALGHARELLALDPLSEAAHRRLIRLHYLAGDGAAALRAFDACERVLKDEIGSRPGPQTLALLATVEASMRPGGRAMEPVLAALTRPPRLLGREPEYHRLLLALQQRQVLLLRGEPGMGKSRLLSELDTEGHRVISVGARPGDGAVAFALARRWLRTLPAVCRIPPDDPLRKVLAVLLPELAEACAAQAGELSAAVETVFERTLTHGPAALVVDDLQFADAASLDLLLRVAERGDAGWVFTMRPAELDEAAQAFCAALQRRSSTQTLDLAPLTPQAVEALLDGLGLDRQRLPGSATALHARTGGNPLYLLETIKAALLPSATFGQPRDGWPVAANVLRLIQQRLARLSDPAMRLARCASVAGQDFRPELAAAVLGVPVLALSDAWAELASAQVLQGERFAHDLIAEAAAASVPAPLARAIHVEVAAWLESHAGEPARVASHWLAAGLGARAVPSLLAAGRQAAKLWQHPAATDFYERAGELLRDRGDRRAAFDALLCAAEAWSCHRVDQRLTQLAEQLERLCEDTVQQAWLACVQITLLAAQRRFADARAAAGRALDQLHLAGADAADVEVELQWSLAALDWDRRDLIGAVRHAEAALARLGDVRPDTQRIDMSGTQLKLLHALGVFHASLGRYAESNRRLEQALDAAGRQDGRHTALGIAATLAANAQQQGAAQRALRWSAQALAHDDRDNVDQNIRAITLSASATVHACNGDPGTALGLGERAVALCDQGLVRHDVTVRCRLATLHAELGRRDLALRAWRTLAARTDLHGPDLPRVQAALLGAGEALPADGVLESIVALDDFPLRAALLCEAQPGCDPGIILPLLAVTAAAARDQGARGIWLAVQARRVAALGQAGRTGEAAELAQAAWEAVADGVVGIEWFSRIGLSLAAALQASAPRQAEAAMLKVTAWQQAAAATLPPMWRDTLLRERGRLAAPRRLGSA